MGRIDVGKIANWIIISAGSILGIGVTLLFSKFLASKNIPLISTVATGIVTFWNMTVAI